jgi:pimeloyl-ACP methyl ester carboxylesterase
MLYNDDTLERFEAEGCPPLRFTATKTGLVDNRGARIWYSTYGSGTPVVLLHGGLGHSGNWGHQVTDLVERGYQPVAIDTRGHGRSTRDEQQPYTYQLLAQDVLAVIDSLGISRAALVGWSDGACTAMVLAASNPERVAGVFFFACNMDPSGAKAISELPPIVNRCFHRHVADYERLSATPDRFQAFHQAVTHMMQTEPNFTAQDLARISVPITIALGEHDEFIHRDHAEYLARTIPNAKFVLLEGVSHFAPLQRPTLFNDIMLEFLNSPTVVLEEHSERAVT